MRISLVPALTPLYPYVSTFRSRPMCAVPNMAVFCSSLTSWFPGMLLAFIIIVVVIIWSKFCIFVRPKFIRHSVQFFRVWKSFRCHIKLGNNSALRERGCSLALNQPQLHSRLFIFTTVFFHSTQYNFRCWYSVNECDTVHRLLMLTSSGHPNGRLITVHNRSTVLFTLCKVFVYFWKWVP